MTELIDIDPMRSPIGRKLVAASRRPSSAIDRVSERHPSWGWALDEIDPLSVSCSRGDALFLLLNAPTDAAATYCLGMIDGRLELARITGRPIWGGEPMLATDSDPELSRACARPRSVLQGAFDKHPSWYALYEEIQPFSATAEEMIALMAGAPTVAVATYVHALIHARSEIAQMTGRDFI
jgi:hypothetical protein